MWALQSNFATNQMHTHHQLVHGHAQMKYTRIIAMLSTERGGHS